MTPSQLLQGLVSAATAREIERWEREVGPFKRAYEDTLAKAQAGDIDAINDLSPAASKLMAVNRVWIETIR